MHGRLVPDYNNVRRYSLRGTVVSHGVHKSGWWIFKSEMPVITVRLRENQWLAFNCLAQEHMRTSDNRPIAGIAPVLELGMTEKERLEYPVGAHIGITFGYSGPTEQFFFGNDALKVMSQEVIRPGVQLVNEMLVPA